MTELFYYFVFFFLSIGFSYYLNGWVYKGFSRNQMVDPITERSSHKSRATRSGGASLLLSLTLTCAFSVSAGVLQLPYVSIVIGVLFMGLTGFVDDIFIIRYREKFFLQIFSGTLIIQGGWSIDSFHGVFGVYDVPQWVGFLTSLFVFIIVINAINLIDGLDGLASLVSIKFFLIAGGIVLISNKEFFVFFPIIVGSLLGFLAHNFNAPKKVFLGDAGSLLLGSLIAFITFFILDSDTYVVSDAYISRPLLLILALFYPLIDTLRAVILRSFKGQSPFVADRIHLHHRLVDKGYEHASASLLILCLSVFLTGLNFLLYLKIGLLLCVIMTLALCLIIYKFLFK